jgi:pimeloyl-[acyl-carrier protein] methyl ester esterase
VDELSLPAVHLAGWSLGTHVICHAALKMGFDTARSLTIVDGTPCFTRRNEDDSWALPLARTKWILRGLERNFTEALTEFITTSCYTKKVVKPETEKMMKSVFFNEQFPPDKKSALELLKDFGNSDIRPMLGSLKLPCLICHGDRDSILPVEISKIWEDLLPNARRIVFENTGHAPFLTQPARFNDSLRAFLHSV